MLSKLVHLAGAHEMARFRDLVNKQKNKAIYSFSDKVYCCNGQSISKDVSFFEPKLMLSEFFFHKRSVIVYILRY